MLKTIKKADGFALPASLLVVAIVSVVAGGLYFWNKGDTAFITENGSTTFEGCATNTQ